MYVAIFGAAALGYVAWQGHAASARVETMTTRIDALANAVRARPAVVLPPPAPAPSAPAPSPPIAMADEAIELPHPDAARIEAAQHRTDEIIRSGVLRPEDVSRLAHDLEGLPRADAFVIRRRIADAINQQALVPTETPFDLP
jgi:hypothetical protein